MEVGFRINLVDLFTIGIYLSIIYELTVIPVPSVASTYQLFFTEDAYDRNGTLLMRVRNWSRLTKLFLIFLPTGLVVVIYLLPLIQAIWSGFSNFLHPVWAGSSTVVIGAGVLIAIFGRIISLYTAWRMRPNNSQKGDNFELKTGGFFDRSRNPNLVGMYTCFIGLWLLYPTWEMAVGFLLFVGNMHFRVLMEEDFLTWKFGRNYTNYKSQKRRYV